MCRLEECAGGRLPLMTIGALFSVEVLRRDAEHVVALNADAMQHWLSGRRNVMLRRLGRISGLLGSHRCEF